MKLNIRAAIMGAFGVLTLAGCGGGGGGGGVSVVATKAITKVHLFGNMTSTSKIASVQTTMTVPNGVMVNYTSTPGATSGTFPLRKGFVVPSGPVQVSLADISGSYDIASRVLTVSLMNPPGSNQVALKSSATGNGAEIATINFILASPGAIPSSMPVQDLSATVGQELPGSPNSSILPGSKINFVTTYQ